MEKKIEKLIDAESKLIKNGLILTKNEELLKKSQSEIINKQIDLAKTMEKHSEEIRSIVQIYQEINDDIKESIEKNKQDNSIKILREKFEISSNYYNSIQQLMILLIFQLHHKLPGIRSMSAVN